jgi:uncharacterized RDD family membrane protein YckC
MQEISILTPEKVIASYRVARMGSRIIAHVIDTMIVVASIFFLSMALSAATITTGGVLATFSQAFLMIYVVFGYFIYFYVFEGAWSGLTPGKKLLKIRVRMLDGTPITWEAALYRNFFRWADILPMFYLVGLVATFVNAKGQRLGDLAASTVTVLDVVDLPVFEVSPHRVGIHPFESHIGDLRKMTQHEYQAIKRLADRYPELALNVRDHLTTTVWLPFKEKHGIPTLANVHDVYLMEAVVMKYGRAHDLL